LVSSPSAPPPRVTSTPSREAQARPLPP
jgi:hypothetical protein